MSEAVVHSVGFPARLFALLLVLLVPGCASTPQSKALLNNPPVNLATTHTVARVPFFPQEMYQCGPAALATMLVHSGVATDAAALVGDVYVPGKQGSFQPEIISAARRHDRLAYRLKPGLETLLLEVEAGNPVLVMQNLGIGILPKWHFAVVKGYDLETASIVLNSGRRENYRAPVRVFERTWARSDYWAVAIPAPGTLPATANADATFTALAELEHSSTADDIIARYYRAATARWPSHLNLRFAAANLFYGMGEIEQAELGYRELIRDFPTFAPAFNNLAHLLLERGEAAEALHFADLAVSLGGRYQEDYRETRASIKQALQNGNTGG